jgi:transcriptional regulator with XRE-family HTH domain
MKGYRAARQRVNVSGGESVRVVRELQGLSQNDLARRTGISQATISAIENDRVRLGVERAKALGRALKCHPGAAPTASSDAEDPESDQRERRRLAQVVPPGQART